MAASGVPCRYGDIDWNEVWKAKQERYDTARIAGDTSHDWDRKENADRYAAQSAGEFEKRIRMTLDGLSLAVRHGCWTSVPGREPLLSRSRCR